MTELRLAGKIPKQSMDEDWLLINEAQKKPQQFKKIYQKWLSPVYRYFYYRLGNQHDAEDLTSQVFIRIYEALPRYENRGCFPAWLFSIARARMVDFYRKNRRELSIEEIETESKFLVNDEGELTKDELHDVLVLIQSLKEDEQELIRLRYFAGLSFAEMGALLNRKEDTVRKSVSRLIERMQLKLEFEDEKNI